MNQSKTYNIPGRLHSIGSEGIVAGADEILDDELNLKQNEINAITGTHIANDEIHVSAAEKEYWNSKVNPPSYSAPTAKTLTYTGEAQDLLNPGSSTSGSIQYSTDETNWSTTVPQGTNAGTYTVYWRFIGSELVYIDSTTINVTIAKANPTYTAPTAKSGLVYNANAQDLLNAGSASNGTISYSEDKENWSSSVPSKTNAGDYVVYWKLTGDSNHNDVSSTAINVSISKVTPTVVAPTAKTGLVYDGTAQELVNAGSTDFGTLQYSADNENWGTSIPTGTNAGDYTVYYKVVGDSNINDVAAQSVSVSVAKNNRNVKFYDDNSHAYIDLGLPSGTLWATMNVGANAETDYGNWYKYGLGAATYDNSQTDYTGTENPLSSNVDTAAQVWGGNWHMPTKAQFVELTTNATYTWATINGVNGGKFTAPNGNYIFIPAAGYWVDGSNINEGSYGHIWSSSPASGGNYANQLLTYTRGRQVNELSLRRYGFSVRGVIESSTKTTLEIGQTNTIAVFTEGSPTITVTSSNTSVATVSGMTVTAAGKGTTTITVTAAGDSNYNEYTYSYTLTVTYPMHNGHEYVDLGLPSGTKWATMNVGANSEEGYGNYYMYGKGSRTYNSSDSAYTGTENPLSMTYDTARQVWGGNWHMPTKAQFEELTANTTYTWTTVNGVNGSKFTAANGNYVFFPAAGGWYDGSHADEGSSGYFWSSSPDGSSDAFYLLFFSGDKGVYKYLREFGYPVRPVLG